MITRRLFLFSISALAACGRAEPEIIEAPQAQLFPGETPEMRALIIKWAAIHEIPESLLHQVIQRESDYRADARNGPYWGLMQILPQTARTMGHRGPPSELLNAETNLKYAGKYLRGAWLVSDGDEATAVSWYARGYYYEAKRRGMLVETGLRPA
ncbi:MAG: lytic transglycosylase domain-containing protein [Pseudomonadota bacterium]